MSDAWTQMPAYIELHRDVVINADLWSDKPEIITADLGFEGIIGIPGLMSAEDLNRAVLAGAGTNRDYAALNPVPDLRNLTSGGSPIGIAAGGFGAAPVLADALPVVFSWPLLPSTVTPTDFQLVLNTGEVVTPVAAALNPNYDYNERHVVVLFGDFANRLTPGTEGARYPVEVRIVDDGSPLQAVGPNGPVSLVGEAESSGNPFVVGPTLVGARLTKMSTVGDFSPPSLSTVMPNDGVSLYGADAQYRLRLYTNGGFSPDGVSPILPTEFSSFFRLKATAADGTTVAVTQTGVEYDLGVGKLQVVGMAELGAPGSTLTRAYYTEDHDNYIDIVLKGDAAAVARLTQVEIPTSAEAGYNDIYTPGGPGRTPVAGYTYTKPSAAQSFAITTDLNNLGTVSYADQLVSDYDQTDGLPVVFRLLNPGGGDHFYTASSREAAGLVNAGYVEEGVAFSNEAGSTALSDVWRLYNAASGDHFYTASTAERDALLSGGSGYSLEGAAFKAYAAATEGATAIHRYYSQQTGDHLYTTSAAEGNAASGYRYEGVAWYSGAFQTDDVFVGGIGDDTLTAGLGRDTLTGGAGADRLVFSLPSDGGDVVTDFQSGQDSIVLTGTAFAGLPAGALSNARFATDMPSDDDDVFIFNTATGALSYDADGARSGTATTIGLFNTRTLSASDIVIAAAV
jgi:hypothetical protein